MADRVTNLIINMLRPMLSGMFKGTIAEQRARMDRSARFFRLPADVKTRRVAADGVAAEWIESPGAGEGVLLYLHGGAYALGSVSSHREMIARLVKATGCNALAINYRLAPEAPYPAALEDSLKAYAWLLAGEQDPARIIVAGDSAGGGLAIATLLALRDEGKPLPAGAVCFSPWLDLTASGDSVTRNAGVDPVLTARVLREYAALYAGSHSTSEVLISPLFADLTGLPPLYLQAGSHEILLDDAARFYRKAQQAGVDTRLDVWDGMFHVFQLIPMLPQSKAALKSVGEFVTSVFSGKTG